MTIQQISASDDNMDLSCAHTEKATVWPTKFNLFGVHVSSTTYAGVVDILIQTGKRHLPALVDFTPVSVLIEAVHDPGFMAKLNSFDLICPDGQPIRWCLNYFHKAGLRDRVCGTTTMLSLCAAAALENLSVYLYGSTPDTLNRLRINLLSRFPGLRIAGSQAPSFRPLGADEVSAAIDRINDSGATFLFVGIGSPKQEIFVWEHRLRIKAVQLCVGAAFDFIAGTRKRAPLWMQRTGLEWLYRVFNEPLRLGKRYALGNAQFTKMLALEIFGHLGRTRRERNVAHDNGIS